MVDWFYLTIAAVLLIAGFAFWKRYRRQVRSRKFEQNQLKKWRQEETYGQHLRAMLEDVNWKGKVEIDHFWRQGEGYTVCVSEPWRVQSPTFVINVNLSRPLARQLLVHGPGSEPTYSLLNNANIEKALKDGKIFIALIPG